MTDVDDLTLAAEFPSATREEWLALVAKVVKVDDPAKAEAALATALFADVTTKPLYVESGALDVGLPGQAPFVRGRRATGTLGGWDVRVHHDNPDPTTAHEQILEDLEGGATSLWLSLGEAGIPLDSLPMVLDEVYLDLVTVALDGGSEFTAAAAAVLALARSRHLDPAELSIRFGADPIGVEARTGATADIDAAVTLAVTSAREYPKARALTLDALPFHLAGADDAQEIACSLAVGVDYVRALRDAGLSAEEAFGEFEFRYAASADQFLTIAKLRAARRTWSRVAAACGVTGPAGGQLQHAVSSPAMLTQRDPWNNILRGTLAGFAAGVGGADAISISPFDAAIGESDRLARRIARNTHALLIEESNVARTVDPAGGSWYVEQLTREIENRAWSVFQKLEAAGGALAALRGGLIESEIAVERDRRLAALAHRETTITGVTEFPNADEVLLTRPARPERAAAGLPQLRWAEHYEAARDRSDAYAAAHGSRPTVAIAAVGEKKSSGASVRAVESALVAGGFVVTKLDPTEATDLPAAAILCRGDEVTDDEVASAVQQLRAAGATTVIGDAASKEVAGIDAVLERQIDVPALHGLVFDAIEGAS